jgi:beta-glucosidase-like glycosyl hydrolase
LLENNGILPLSGKPRVAVVGPTADDPLALLSGYSFPASDHQRYGGRNLAGDDTARGA